MVGEQEQTRKEKSNAQRSEASDNESSGSESSNESTTEIVAHSSTHALGWSGSHLSTKGNVSFRDNNASKVKLAWAHEVEKSED